MALIKAFHWPSGSRNVAAGTSGFCSGREYSCWWNFCSACRKLVCPESGKPIGAERRVHGGGVVSIEQKCRISTHRPRASAEPRPCLHDETIEMRIHEPPACGDTSRAAAHNHDLGIAVGHALFRTNLDRDVRFDRATDRAVPTMPVHAVSMPILLPRSKRQQRLFAPIKSTPPRALAACRPSGTHCAWRR